MERQAYLEYYKQLTEVYLEGKGIPALLETAGTIFQKPVMLLDSSCRYMFAAGTKDQDNPAQEEAFRHAKVLETSAQQEGICYFTNPLSGAEAASAALYIRNTVVACLVVSELTGNLDEEEEDLFMTLRSLISQELMKNRAYQSHREEYMSYLLMDMLTNKYPDEMTIQKRLETVDFIPADHMNVVVIRKRIESSRNCSLELVATQLRPALTGAVFAVIEDCLVLLFNFPREKKLNRTVLDTLRQVCANNDLIAGISSSFTALSDLVKHYRLATRTALVCQRYIEDHRVIFYDDVFDLALLEYCDRHNHLMDYVHSSILNLMEYDQKYGTDYLYTFWIYTECGCNTQATASRLYIHKNTLVYRVNKIKELLDSDLSSGKDMFAFQLSMRILRMLGKLAK